MIIDIHTHTSYGSPCSYIDPTELIRRAKRAGLDGVCITEHNVTWKEEEIRGLQEEHDFLVIGGVEVGTRSGEVLVFGVHEPVIWVSEIADLRALVDSAGGVMIAAHPFRSDAALPKRDDPEIDKALAAAAQRPVLGYVDAIEVFNGRHNKWERDFTAKVAGHLHLKGTGGSDAHAGEAVGSCYTEFENSIRNEQDLIQAIKQGMFEGKERRSREW